MPKPTTARAARSQPAQQPPPPADPDLVDRLFELLRADPRLPAFPPAVLAEVEADLRSEFAGERPYIAANSHTARQQRMHDVLRLFNGQNAAAVARTLGIGRTTVFRVLKQAGRSSAGRVLFKVDPADRSTFAGNGTPPPIPSDDA